MDNQKMGIYIAAKRKERQMTQTDLAQQLHITRQAVSKWESGKSVPDPETLLAMAALFQVTVEEILGGEDVPTDPPVPMEVPAPVSGRFMCFRKPLPASHPSTIRLSVARQAGCSGYRRFWRLSFWDCFP